VNAYAVAGVMPGTALPAIVAAVAAASDAQRPLRAQASAAARAFGLRLLSYEGSLVALPLERDDATTGDVIEANRSPQWAGAMVRDFQQNWAAAEVSGEEFNFFALSSQYGPDLPPYEVFQWGLTEDVHNNATNKLKAVREIAAGALARGRTAQRRPHVVDADSPTCAVNGKPCPLPPWPATYNLTESTIMYYFNCDNRNPPLECDDKLINQPGQPWGIVGIDWQISAGLWSKCGFPQTYPGELTMIENCAQIKQLGQAKRCLIYQNLEVALQWHESQRALMNDARLADWFVSWHNSQNVSNGTHFNSAYGGCTGCWNVPGGPNGKAWPWSACDANLDNIHETSPGSRCFGSQFLWNFTSREAQDTILQSIIGVVESGGDFVDGLFTDDLGGFPDEHEGIQNMLNISGSYTSGDLFALRNASQTMSQRLIDELPLRGKFVWHAFQSNNNVGDNWNSNGVNGTSFDSAHCTAWMSARCNSDFSTLRAWTTQMDPFHVNTSLASFLIARGPYSFIGWGAGYYDPVWVPEFLWSVGAPQGNCSQVAPGVFEREWSFGTARLNCSDPLRDVFVPVDPNQPPYVPPT
jgi:hypothetical protein